MARRTWQERAWAPFTIAAAIAIAGGAGGACTGNLGDPGGEDDGEYQPIGVGADGDGEDGADGEDGEDGGGANGQGQLPIETAPRLAFPRLSHSQWENTVQHLFRLREPTGLSISFNPDLGATSTFDNDEDAKEVTEELWVDYQRAATEVAAMVCASPDILAAIAPAGADARTFIEALGKRAYRRPLTSIEVGRFEALFAQGAELDESGTDAFVAGAKIVIEAMLQSPHFIYRVELGGAPNEEGDLPLTDWEVATRLSYTLWNTMPDDQLFDAAQAGELASTEGVAVQVDRMMASEAARSTLVSFVDQLFKGDDIEDVTKSAASYPEWSEAHGPDMREELSRFAGHVLFEAEGGLREMMLSRTSFVNARLAAIYGLSGDFGEELVEVELDERRAGLLTRSGFLAWKGTASSTPDTILRGAFITRMIMCTDPGDPPDEAMGAELEDGNTNRQKIENLTGVGTCGEGCHSIFINPPGFALENFDSIGAWRDQDAGETIDASSNFVFDGEEIPFDGPAEFAQLVAESEAAHRCWSSHWVEFTFGRGVTEDDEGLIQHLTESSRDGAGALEVVREMILSPAFLTRKPAEVGP